MLISDVLARFQGDPEDWEKAWLQSSDRWYSRKYDDSAWLVLGLEGRERAVRVAEVGEPHGTRREVA